MLEYTLVRQPDPQTTLPSSALSPNMAQPSPPRESCSDSTGGLSSFHQRLRILYCCVRYQEHKKKDLAVPVTHDNAYCRV